MTVYYELFMLLKTQSQLNVYNNTFNNTLIHSFSDLMWILVKNEPEKILFVA